MDENVETLSESSSSTGQEDGASNTLSDDERNAYSHREMYRQLGCWKCLTSENLLFRVSTLPILFAWLILSGLFIDYAIAVSMGHVSALLPYVSWLGSQGPEQYIFDFIMSLASITVAFIFYMKFKAIGCIYNGPHYVLIMVFNKVNSWVGLTSSLFFLVSATFPAIEEYNIGKVHGNASIAAFVILCVYFYLESIMSFIIRHRVTGVTMLLCVTRTVIAVLSTGCLITSYISGKRSFKEFNGEDAKKWLPTDSGYTLHLVAAFCEWSIVLLMVVFFLTFYQELKHLESNVSIACRDTDNTNEESGT